MSLPPAVPKCQDGAGTCGSPASPAAGGGGCVKASVADFSRMRRLEREKAHVNHTRQGNRSSFSTRLWADWRSAPTRNIRGQQNRGGGGNTKKRGKKNGPPRIQMLDSKKNFVRMLLTLGGSLQNEKSSPPSKQVHWHKLNTFSYNNDHFDFVGKNMLGVWGTKSYF